MNNVEFVIAALMAAILAPSAADHRFASQRCPTALQMEDSQRSSGGSLPVVNAIPVAKCRVPLVPAGAGKTGFSR